MKRFLASPSPWLTLCIAALIFRVTLGVDLGDESYYTAFIDGWLKTGLRGNTFLMVHQTADLLVYPLALVYRVIRGSADGLVLFLRLVYLAVATLSAISLYRAVEPFRGRVIAVPTAILALLFIPFSLPAPSYNTIGMYALMGALSLFAAGFGRAFEEGRSAGPAGLPVSLWLSGVWWAVGCLAYPPMLAPLAMVCVLSLACFRTPEEGHLLRRYILACVVLLAAAFSALCIALGPAHLLQVLRFTNAFNNVSGGVSGKIQTAFHGFAAQPRLALICLAAVAVAVVRCFQRPPWRALSDAATFLLIVGVATSTAPAFYSRTHDLVLVLAVTGVGLGLRQLLLPGQDRLPRVLGLVLLVSVAGGLTTAATAFNGLFNFPIGGFVAACLALVLPQRTVPLERAAGFATIATACLAMAMTTFTSFYGQIGAFSYTQSVRVPHGAFAGLRTDREQATFIERMTEAIGRQQDCGRKLAVMGTGPGFYLLTDLSPTALSSWNYPGDARNFATDAVRDFYEIPANQPDVLVVNNWRWATPLSSSDRALLEKYRLTERVAVGIRDASVYRRANCPGD